MYVVSAKRSGPLELELYFDRDTHFLVREIRYTDSPLGRNPMQLDYADYRNVKRRRSAVSYHRNQAGNFRVIEFDDVQDNFPISDPLRSRSSVVTRIFEHNDSEVVPTRKTSKSHVSRLLDNVISRRVITDTGG